MDHTELFWKVPLKDLKQGYYYQEPTGEYICLVCGQTFEKGIIYSDEGTFYEAGKFAERHVAREHGSMFDFFLGLNKKLTGLSDLQKSLLRLFYDGYSDNEIVKKLDGGSASTIRNHRFALREKEKQARLFLAIMELLEQKNYEAKGQDKPTSRKTSAPVQKTAAAGSKSYDTTEEEYQNLVLTYFKEGLDGPLSTFPTKAKRKLAVLRHLIGRFEPGVRYTEKEVNAILREAYHDYVTLRRYMIEFGLLDREDDGSAYWVQEGATAMTEERRKELVRAYNEIKRPMGVYRIRNKLNGKSWIGSSANMEAMWNRTRFELSMKNGRSKPLQNDWDEYGSEAFEFEVLEELKEPKGSRKDTADELKAMEAKWIGKLQPFGDKGYHE
ncbi:DUF2087 domain-containing protein [Paenibacillus sp. H1-7]|uniref:DUF2087 domain-containing protein n=1 Tax=Paenibacillus sp. H1-7 TaxID=2282849 RepID=UPI001EF89744|nr:DUF2087 domain-containing protein [Paenibacillus sp. H1-7]ULL17805.1 DUF2087 domain-containing protein [Paenibacillus sp. H1-7]